MAFAAQHGLRLAEPIGGLQHPGEVVAVTLDVRMVLAEACLAMRSPEYRADRDGHAGQGRNSRGAPEALAFHRRVCVANGRAIHFNLLRRRPKISEPVLNSVIPAKAGTQVA